MIGAGPWRLEIDGLFLRSFAADVPNGLELSHVCGDRDMAVYLPPVVAQVVGFWYRHALRWAPWRLAVRLGFLYDPPGNCGFHATMRWRWDFWNGNRSWLAMQYLKRHGWDAYKARFA